MSTTPRRTNESDEEWSDILDVTGRFDREFSDYIQGRREAPPRIEVFIRENQLDTRRWLAALIGRELDLQRTYLENVTPRIEYLDRFPDFSTEIDMAFENVQSGAPTVSKASDDASDLRVPISLCTKNGRTYEIKRVLGQGGFCVVYLAHEKGDSKLVALKVAREDKADVWRTERVKQEFDQMVGFDGKPHKNIVKYLKLVEGVTARFGNAERREIPVMIVMEYVPGLTLYETLSAGPLHPYQAADYALEIAWACWFLHSKLGLIHRDLKPGNIMLNKSRGPVLLDFGLALKTSREPACRKEGTEDYMSPEDRRADRFPVSSRNDIYSLGKIIVEMFYGEKHLPKSSDGKGYSKNLPYVSEDASREIWHICATCLHEDSSERYQSAQELCKDLEKWISEHGSGRRRKVIRRRAVIMGALLVTCSFPLASILLLSNEDNSAVPLKVHEWRAVVDSPVGPDGSVVPRGKLGKDYFNVRIEDQITITAETTAPAYCYWLAFDPTGEMHECMESDSKDGTTRPYDAKPLAGTSHVGLYTCSQKEGSGMLVFALVGSKERLEPFETWKASAKVDWTPPARSSSGKPGQIYVDGINGGIYDAEHRLEGANRYPGIKLTGGQKIVRSLAAQLKARSEFEFVQVVGFQVQPNVGD